MCDRVLRRILGPGILGPAGLVAGAWTVLPFPAMACAAITVPEPTTLSLVGAGAVAMIVVRRMRGDK